LASGGEAFEPAKSHYAYFQFNGQILRRSTNGRLSELRANRWYPAPWQGARVADRSPKDIDAIDRRRRQLMVTVELRAEDKSLGPLANHWRRAREWVVPPLDFGAPRHFGDEARQDGAEAAYDEELPLELAERLCDELVAQARDGYERQGDRVAAIERRAGIYQGASNQWWSGPDRQWLVAATKEFDAGASRTLMLLGLVGIALLAVIGPASASGQRPLLLLGSTEHPA
jgi:hypothetical protein